MIRSLVLTVLCLGWCGSAFGLDRVTLKRDGTTRQIDGQILVTAEDGGMLVKARDGRLWAVQPQELVEKTADKAPFKPLTQGEMAAQLLKELPAGFQVYRTRQYVICYNTSRAYAQWCGSLLQRLYMAFTNHWTRRGFELSELEFPLVAIIFSDKRSFVDFSRAEVGDAVESIIGYYSLRTNRMVMYDLSGIESINRYATDRKSQARIKEFLRRPDAERFVATIVHEATHQIAHNCGLHTRYSDCPLWFSEGIAVYFETPDLSSSRGWRNIGAINRPRLAQLRNYLGRRPPDSLATLLASDERLGNTEHGPDAYAEAWALTYFLLRQHPEEYVEYLKLLSQKKPLVWDSPETRLSEFKQIFGEDLKQLDTEFLRYVSSLK